MSSNVFEGCGYEIFISSYKSSAMKSGDDAYIFFLDIKNTSNKRIKVHLQPTTYTTSDGYEIDQDVWLTGHAIGVGGISIKSGAFKRAGLVYFQSKLSKITPGDELEVHVVNETSGVQHLLTLRSVSSGYATTPGMTEFAIVSVEEERYEGDRQVAQDDENSNKSKGSGKGIESGKPTDITPLVERLELVEEKLGVRFEGIGARARKRLENSPPDYIIEVVFDIVGSEESLKRSFCATISAYNSGGQLINTCYDYIDKDRFIGIKSSKLNLECHEKPVRIRLFPANPI